MITAFVFGDGIFIALNNGWLFSAYNILAQDGRVSLDYILLYLERRLNRKPDGRDKKEVYLALLELLKGQGPGNWDDKGKKRQNNREIMLV